ncbi:LIRP isoform X2 [Formica exsecta]|uniref:LIRP isoform X2 n=1 Tax=Formica exsecta TaxID=72781 RepID=UPI001141FA16|nr:LIRP isoform X2 [Formica exsecta]
MNTSPLLSITTVELSVYKGGGHLFGHHKTHTHPSSNNHRHVCTMSANRLNVLVTMMIAIAFLATESGNAQADGYPQFNPKRPTMSVPQKYCGKKLSNALQIICDGVYNSMFKKSGQAREEGSTGHRDINFDYVRTQEMEMADYPLAYEFPPFLPRARARGMLDGPFAGRRYRRESRGIHEECCLNACTISELSSYCGP